MPTTISRNKSSRVGSRLYRVRRPQVFDTVRAALDYVMKHKYIVTEHVSTPRGIHIQVVTDKGQARTLTVRTEAESGGVVRP